MSDIEIFLSVVLPCRNQGDHIAQVLSQYSAPLDKIGKTYELVVVPNACTDNTPQIVAQLAACDPKIRMVENPHGGWGLSVLTGLSAARGKVLCYTNSARTDPSDIPVLLELYQQNLPCLAKIRREKRGIVSREIGSWLYNLEGRMLYGIQARDVNGTPKIFSRELVEKLALQSNGDLLDMELLAKATRLNLKIVEHAVQGFKRHGGKSSTNLASAARMYLGAWSLRKDLQRFAKTSV